MMMMMNGFCGMVDQRKAFSLILSWNHFRISSPSRISYTARAGFEPAKNLSSGFVEWTYAVVITTTPKRHVSSSIRLELSVSGEIGQKFGYSLLKIKDHTWTNLRMLNFMAMLISPGSTIKHFLFEFCTKKSKFFDYSGTLYLYELQYAEFGGSGHLSCFLEEIPLFSKFSPKD